MLFLIRVINIYYVINKLNICCATSVHKYIKSPSVPTDGHWACVSSLYYKPHCSLTVPKSFCLEVGQLGQGDACVIVTEMGDCAPWRPYQLVSHQQNTEQTINVSFSHLITGALGTPQFCTGGNYLTCLTLAPPCITFQSGKIINSLISEIIRHQMG